MPKYIERPEKPVREGVTPKYRALAERASQSRRAAVRSFCLECMGWSANDVKDCTDLECALWNFREKG